MTSTADKVRGACNCGAINVAIESSSFPKIGGLCHCLNCQASCGSLFSYNLPTPIAAISITGTPKIFTETTNKGTTAHRHFCGDCGSPIMTTVVEKPETAYVKGGLFRKSGVELPKPAAQIYMLRAGEWEVPLEGVHSADLDLE
ncbi:hypothetical protein VE01_03881 [Pseudogymnoascus verrucosus]|uniref:CENP-V/GFA domain-containing protein n=1 Tax=Pseudogymnoascus verrucosus TaxID=342668 RepID=A0A1B8GQ34_9PEZI|nr:uncharacterized protein VE01_03881 [Pseudogymnoascus verrucosus]OBT97945.1 hypothetical protein VE01_03881 [Pseudogymnoascus verrucosus]